MAKNADDKSEEDNKPEEAPVTEEDLQKLKDDFESVEPAKAEDEPEKEDESSEDSKETEDEAEAESTDEESDTFTKKFPNIKGEKPEEYLPNLETAYDNSFAEGLRLDKENRDLKAKLAAMEEDDENPTPPKSAAELYVEQKLNDEMVQAFSDVSADYPTVRDPVVYDKFVKTVEVLTNTIFTSEERLASPSELYSKAAVILGLEKNSTSDKDKVAEKLKEGAGTPKSSPSKPSVKSKVSDADVVMFKKLNPESELSDSEIRKELEPHIN